VSVFYGFFTGWGGKVALAEFDQVGSLHREAAVSPNIRTAIDAPGDYT
jgi:hypothetical protein